MKQLAVLQGLHTRKVQCLAFSAKGDHLLSVGGDDQHTVAMYDWKQQKLKMNCPGGGLQVSCKLQHTCTKLVFDMKLQGRKGGIKS